MVNMQVRTKRLLLGILLSSCLPPLPPPGKVPPPPDVGPADVFTNYVADCGLPTVAKEVPSASPVVQSCFEDPGSLDTCLVRASATFTKDTLVCLVTSLDVVWQLQVARGLATDDEKAHAATANRWVYSHQIGVRQ